MFPSNPHWENKGDMYGKTLKNLDPTKKKNIVKLGCTQNLLTKLGGDNELCVCIKIMQI